MYDSVTSIAWAHIYAVLRKLNDFYRVVRAVDEWMSECSFNGMGTTMELRWMFYNKKISAAVAYELGRCFLSCFFFLSVL